MKKFAMMVLGCKVNDYEATYVRTKLLDDFEEVSFKEIADIYIVFTCCVTNTAEAKTRKMLHHARKLNKSAYIVAVGCLAQIKGHTEEFDNIDLVIGSNHKDEIVDLIKSNVKVNKVENLINPSFEELYLETYPGKSRSFLKIQDGCNQFCSYCVIPYARGRERSANHTKLIEQAKILSITNKELVLTGIHTGRYFDGEYNLYMLLHDLENIDSLETIRLSSIEITEINDDIINLIKNSKKIAHHLHIPVQSCCDEILNLMNRPYKFNDYLNRIEFIRHEIPDISISTDLIVGFPGETDDLFDITINNLNKIRFSFVHAFPYAKKMGTKAEKLPNHLNNDIKKKRVNKVINNQINITKEFNEKFINKKVSILVEKTDNDYIYGYAKQYFYVKAKGYGKIGDLIDVAIDEANDEVIGHVIK